MVDELFQEFLDRNERSLQNHQSPPLMKDLVNMDLGTGGICILSCSDARVDPAQFFGLRFGEALIIRNAGARAADAMRSLAVMGSIAPIALIVVVHHTDCGAVFTTDEEIRTKLCSRAPAHASAIENKWFGTFGAIGLDESIRQDVEEIRSWPFLPAETQVVGFALDIETGKVRQVVPKSA